jgi:hypothetical protein
VLDTGPDGAVGEPMWLWFLPLIPADNTSVSELIFCVAWIVPCTSTFPRIVSVAEGSISIFPSGFNVILAPPFVTYNSPDGRKEIR